MSPGSTSGFRVGKLHFRPERRGEVGRDVILSVADERWQLRSQSHKTGVNISDFMTIRPNMIFLIASIIEASTCTLKKRRYQSLCLFLYDVILGGFGLRGTEGYNVTAVSLPPVTVRL